MTKPLFDVTLIGPGERLRCTNSEVMALRDQGQAVRVEPAPEGSTTPFADAMRALSVLAHHAERTGNAKLQAKCGDAIQRFLEDNRFLSGGEVPERTRTTKGPAFDRPKKRHP